MNPTYVHLLLNHIPILGSAFGALLLLYAFMIKSNSVKDAALLAFIITALFTVPVFLSGEPAEESVESIAGISKAAIEEHEESAEVALWMMEALGVLSLITFVLRKKENELSGKLTAATLFFALIAFALMARTGSEGGKIRHTELTNGTIQTMDAGAETEEKSED